VTASKLTDVRSAIEARGLSYRGAFHPTAEDLPDGSDVGTLVLVGFTGNTNWQHFRDSPEARDGAPDPLDRWSRRVIGALAEELGATALFPFAGPPWLPFLKWAQKAEPVHPSPLGMLIHPDWGLWHSWRGALAFRETLELPPPDRRPRPCDTCADKPCLSACPVNAFTRAGYHVAACIAHIDSPRGTDCMEEGCRARRACPIGVEHRYSDEQAEFHMRAFRKAQK
jgi:ferredoxin